jgi:hypothetical protein
MRRPSSRSLLCPLWLCILAVVFGAVAARAQTSAGDTIFVGTFTLPFEAHWGKYQLSAGNYSFTVQRGIRDQVALLHLKESKRDIGTILPIEFSDYDARQIHSGTIRCVLRSGTYTVRELALPGVGAFQYAIPSNAGGQMAKEQEATVAIFEGK